MNHIHLPIHRRTMLKTISYALILGIAILSACQAPEDPPAPVGRLQVIHANPQEGSIEILLENQVLLSVAPGQLSEVAELPQGPHILSLRKAGAMSAYFTTEEIDFGDELNLLAISLNRDGDEEILYLDDDAPMAEEGVHYVRVLDLSGQDRVVKVFHGSSLIIELPLENHLSSFISTEATETAAPYTLLDVETSSPIPVYSESVAASAGGVSLLVIQPGNNADYSLTVLSIRE